MAPEGMVHALEQIHRLLRPMGRLIDIHPTLDARLMEIHDGGRITFATPPPRRSDDDIQQAENALTDVIQRGLFEVERAARFDFLTYASSVTELRDFLDEANAYEDTPVDEEIEAQRAALAARVEELMRAAGAGAEVAVRERATIARLKPLR